MKMVSAYKNLLIEVKEGICTITINRPEVRNALNRETWHEIRDVIGQVDEDDSVKVVIITGAGEKAFIAGADVRTLKERSMMETLGGENQIILNNLESLSKPVIAAVNGVALGGGCEVAMACDIRIASENAKFGQPELSLGILPGAGGTQRLSRLVGLGKAKELVFCGEIIDAHEAEKIGLVNRVVAASQLMPVAYEMAAKIMQKGPVALKLAKVIMNAGAGMEQGSAILMERLAQSIIFSTEDRLEGISAFLEKRRPDFQGK
jgi:enoyl-CoA hydratase